MKKLTALVLALLLVAAMPLALASCSDDSKYTVGIAQWAPHSALDAATKGFKDALVEELGEDQVTFLDQNAQGDAPTCTTIINDFTTKNVDLIFANATPALQTAAAATTTIPILGTSVTEYGIALNKTLTDGVVGGNISGTSDLAPLDKQADMLAELFPPVRCFTALQSPTPSTRSTPSSPCLRQRATLASWFPLPTPLTYRHRLPWPPPRA